MNKNNLIRFVQSLVLLPAMTVSFGNVQGIDTPRDVLVKQINSTVGGVLALNQALNPQTESLKTKAEAIDVYFRERGMPLEGLGAKMVEEAEENELDWRLLAAIAVRESTGGKHACKRVPNNPFGWGSCKIGFDSNEEAIEVVAKNLGGNNPNTARHYEGKDTVGILKAYNPPSVVKEYSEQVVSIMDEIGEKEISAPLKITNA